MALELTDLRNRSIRLAISDRRLSIRRPTAGCLLISAQQAASNPFDPESALARYPPADRHQPDG